MNKHSILTLISLALVIALPAQKRYQQYYKDQLGKGEKMLNASYNSIFIQDAAGQYVRKIFYPETKILTHYFTCKDANFSIKEGLCREWYDNGRLWKEGNYKNNEFDGEWTFYEFESGKKAEYGAYEKGKRTGRWTSLDSLGRIIKIENFKEGKLHGACNIFNKSGDVAVLITYEEGKKIREDKWIDHAEFSVVLPELLDVAPYVKVCENENADERKACSEGQYLGAIYKNIHYPEKAREEGMEGSAIIRFTIEKTGAITNIRVLRGLCESIEYECRRVMKFMPEWMPGLKDGMPVQTHFNLPIRFRLE